jgi:hypothetical protein
MGLPIPELAELDRALYRAVANSSTPSLDAGLRTLSKAANNSALWLGAAGIIALVGGNAGRRAAVDGVLAKGEILRWPDHCSAAIAGC